VCSQARHYQPDQVHYGTKEQYLCNMLESACMKLTYIPPDEGGDSDIVIKVHNYVHVDSGGFRRGNSPQMLS